MVETYHEWYENCLRHMVGMLVEAYGWCTPLMISYGTWLMYMGVVHGGHILVHDALGGYIVHDSLFHWWHIFCFMIYGMAQVWCMNRSKDRHMVAYCSYCREDRGSHSSSHDSRRRYLSDAYQEKSPIFEERGQRHGSKWIRFIRCRGQRHGFRGSMTDMILVLHQSDIPCSKGKRLFKGRSKEFR